MSSESSGPSEHHTFDELSVAAVVVTYNRCDFLADLLPSLLEQSRPLQAIYVVDNASTDGTAEFLDTEYGDNELIRRVTLSENTGGSGGFHAGVVAAFADGHDWFWLMDDDVIALPDGLEGLLPFTEQGGCLHGRRIDFHGGAFFWQPRINEYLGIPLPYLRDPFEGDEDSFETNSGVFEGMMVSRDVVAEIGAPTRASSSRGTTPSTPCSPRG